MDIYEPPRMTSIQIPTLNEAKYLGRSISSLQNQSVVLAHPRRFELQVLDSASTDGTQDIARSMGVGVLESSLGKLTARDLGARMANGDVIFSGDADTYYGPNHLNSMLRHFRDPGVVGVYGPYAHDHPVMSLLSLTRIFQPERFLGLNNAFLRDAYLAAPFDLTIDQTDHETMVMEEEKNFLKRLEAQGKVVYDRSAVALASMRRYSMADPDFTRAVNEGTRFQEPSRVF